VSSATKAKAKAKKEVARIARAAHKARRSASNKAGGASKPRAATPAKPATPDTANKTTSAQNWETNTIPAKSGTPTMRPSIASAKGVKRKEDLEVWQFPTQLWQDSAPPTP